VCVYIYFFVFLHSVTVTCIHVRFGGWELDVKRKNTRNLAYKRSKSNPRNGNKKINKDCAGSCVRSIYTQRKFLYSRMSSSVYGPCPKWCCACVRNVSVYHVIGFSSSRLDSYTVVVIGISNTRVYTHYVRTVAIRDYLP